MRLICPCCGAVASIEAWANDATSRKFMDVAMKLPHQVQNLVLAYLGLFRRGAKNGLSWPRALRVLIDLQQLIEPGTVQWDGGEVRPAPPELWARALDAVLARRPQALTNHNYLRRTAWDLAKGMAAAEESALEGRRREARGEGREAGGEGLAAGSLGLGEEPATPEQRAELARMMREWRLKTEGR